MANFTTDTLLLQTFEAGAMVSPTGQFNRTWTQGGDVVRLDNRNTAMTRGTDYADFGVGGYSLTFIGSADQYLHCTEPLTIDGDITINFIFKCLSTDNDCPVFFWMSENGADDIEDDSKNKIMLALNSSGNSCWYAMSKNPTFTKDYDYRDNQWHIVTILLQKSSGKIIIAIDEDASTVGSSVGTTIPSSLYFGYNIKGRRWNGYLDNVRIQKGIDTTYPMKDPSNSDYKDIALGTVVKGQEISLSQFANGIDFEWDATNKVLQNGRKSYMVCGYTSTFQFTCTPQTRLNINFVFKAQVVTYQYVRILIRYPNNKGTLVNLVNWTNYNTFTGTTYTTNPYTYSATLNQGVEYTITFQFYMNNLETTTISNATAYNYTSQTNRWQRVKLSKIYFSQAFAPKDLSYIDSGSVFDLSVLADGYHFVWDSSNSRLMSGSNSYNIDSGYSKAAIRFMPTATGIVTIKYGISSQSGQDIGAIYLQDAVLEEDESGNRTWNDFFQPTLAQAKAGTVPSNTYNLVHVLHTSGEVAESEVTVAVSAGVYYCLGLHYIKSASTNTGDDRFFIYEISFEKTVAEYNYLSYINAAGKHASIPILDVTTSVAFKMVKDGNIIQTNTYAQGESKASDLLLPYNRSVYAGEKDFVTQVDVPSMIQNTFTFKNANQSATFTYDSEHILVTGTRTASQAGSYNLIFVLRDKEHYRWTSGGTDNRVLGYTWTIKKIKPTISVSVTEVNTDVDHYNVISVTYSNAYSGKYFSISSANTDIATTGRYNANIAWILGKSIGTTTIRIWMDADANYEASNVITLTVNVYAKKWKWSEIQTLLSNGTLQNTFPVGSYIPISMKAFTLAGRGTNEYEISEHEGFALILGYNHNVGRESEGNTVTMQLMSTMDDTDHGVVYCFAAMETSTDAENKGWAGSNMFATNMPRVMAAISGEKYISNSYGGTTNNTFPTTRLWCLKYSNNGQGNTAKNLVRNLERVYLPSHYEISGTAHSNDVERVYQKQFEYYKQGGSKIRNYFNGNDKLGTTSGKQITRSFSKINYFCGIDENGGSENISRTSEYGIAPVFTLKRSDFVDLTWEQLRYLAENSLLQTICPTGTVLAKQFTISSGPYAGTYAATLIGLDHNAEYEGKGRAHFEIRAASGIAQGNKISFFDASLGLEGDAGSFRHGMNNSKGWQNSELRRTILPAFYEYLPEELKEQIFPCPKYTDNVGGGSNTEGNISCTSDELWLLSEVEVGAQKNSNSAMSTYCKVYNQYGGVYTSNANRQHRKKNAPTSNVITDMAITWLRDPDINSSTDFCQIEKTGTVNVAAANMGYGINPCFTIGGQKYAKIEHISGDTEEISWQELSEKIIDGTHSLAVGDIVWFPMRSFNFIQNASLNTKRIRGGMFGARVIGINHNSSIEGDNRVHFQICRYPGTGLPISFHASTRSVKSTDISWTGSVIRLLDLHAIFAALPRDLQRVITPVKKGTNGSFNYETMFILSIREILGSNSYDENDDQQQYSFFVGKSGSQLASYTYDGNEKFIESEAEIHFRDNKTDKTLYMNIGGQVRMQPISALNALFSVSPCFTIGKPDTISDAQISLNGTMVNLSTFAGYVKAGNAQNYLALGDVVPINFSDIVYKINNTDYACVRAGTYGARVIGFNHNSSIEGNNTVHFQICKLGSHTIAFSGAAMSTSGSKDGGYSSASLMKSVMTAVYSAMPSAWRSIIAKCNKYTDKGTSTDDTTGSVISDYMWLPSLVELFGTDQSVSYYTIELSKNVQYDFFKNRGNKIDHDYRAYDGDVNHGDFLRPIWLRSTSKDSDGWLTAKYNDVNNNIVTDIAAPNSLCCFTPCFIVSGANVSAKVTQPSATPTTFTYNGSSQGPTIANKSNYDGILSFTGTSEINAGNYTLTMSIINPVYTWSTGGSADKEISWTINKAVGNMTLSATSVTLDSSNNGKVTITITTESNGQISISNNNSTVVSAILSGKNISLSALNNGTAKISVSIAAGTNHTAISQQEISVSVIMGAAIDVLTWQEISEYSKAGTLGNYITLGAAKTIVLNGSVNEMYFEQENYKAVCISLAEDDTLEDGTAIKTSHWAIIQNSSGKQIAFCDDDYFSTNIELSKFAHHQSVDTNANGWQDSEIRTLLNTQFLTILPNDLSSVIINVAKYTNNTTGSDKTVTPIYDQLWIPSVKEFVGNYETYADIENNSQYSYFTNVTYRKFTCHNNIANMCAVATRQRRASSNNCFYAISNSGGGTYYASIRSLGIVPCFAVGNNNHIDLRTVTPGQTYTFGLGSYTVASSASISTEDGSLHNLNTTVAFNYDDEIARATKYSITIEAKILASQQKFNGFCLYWMFTDLKGFRFVYEQRNRINLTEFNVTDPYYSFNLNTWYKMTMKIINQQLTWIVNDNWSVTVEMNSTLTLSQCFGGLYSGLNPKNSLYVRTIDFSIL